MTRRSRNSIRRRAFTLVESLAVVIVLSIAVPPAVSMMVDAARTQADSVKMTRATWFATSILENIIADVNSDDVNLGFSALDDSNAYLTTATTGLNNRLSAVIAHYNGFGLTHSVQIGALSESTGAVSGTPSENVFRTITVGVTWTNMNGVSRTLNIGAVVTDL